MRRAVLIPIVWVVLAGSARAQDPGDRPDPAAQVQPRQTDTVARGWQQALGDSIRLLAIEHGFRVAMQADTRRELAGPFFADYRRALNSPEGWWDGNHWAVNYIGHPIHGAAAGYLWRDSTGRPSSAGLGLSGDYWKALGQSGAWMTAYSLQFEFGLFSEASIGNVGTDPVDRGWVDHVVTPIGGMGLMVAEDAMDKYFLRWVESRTSNGPLRVACRIFFNPARSLANLAQGKFPWYRADRALGDRP